MSCPFLEAGNKECQKSLTLKNLHKAVSHCANDYTECRVYRELFRRKMIRRQVLTRKTA